MVNPLAFLLVTIILAVAAACCAVRLYYLDLIAVYPAVFAFLVLQLATSAASNAISRASDDYAFLYVVVSVSEWIVYGFLIHEIFSLIFKDFPGIAFAGRSSVYVALVWTGAICTATLVWIFQFRRQPATLLNSLQFLSDTLIVGFAVLIAAVLYSVSKYPLRLRYNLVYNSTCFGAVLLGEAIGILMDLGTGRRYTADINLAVSLVAALAVTAWPLLLSHEGQTALKLHPHLSRSTERELLDELAAVNKLLLRVAGK